jgi:5-(carboxyamino)imidazole ribonucleotide synthase
MSACMEGSFPMRETAKPLPALGICGGGQLAKMTAQAAAQFGCAVVILERHSEFPAASRNMRTLIGNWDDPASLLQLAGMVDVVTLENEFVDEGALATLEQAGHPLWPKVGTLRRIQDKLIQKQTLAQAGLPVPRMRAVWQIDEVAEAAAEWGYPVVLKARRQAYDGKGNATVRTPLERSAAWSRLGGDRGRTLYVEEFCDFAMELAVIVTRGQDGATVVYPVVETIQEQHICRVVRAPAAISAATAAAATELARQAVCVVEGVGSFGVELFLDRSGRLRINELAPRVHNSGHYTMEACICSQFENHVRAVLGWPLGSPAMRAPAAVMINLLGSADAPGRPLGIERALAIPGVHVHVYGKKQSARGRKMGHVTALGATVQEASTLAERASEAIRFEDPT